MSRLRISPRTYSLLTFVALGAVAFIIVTGAAVRLTGSGLGCSDWPNCEENQLVAPLEFHPMVEFVNRTVTGFVSVAVILAVLGSFARLPRRTDLIWLSLGLVAGVIGQIVLGGLTVLFELKPPLVMGHFLLSIVILANALVLAHRAARPDAPARRVTDARTRTAARIAYGLTCAALFTGTIVTAAGPHGGDEDVERLSWPLPDVTRVHATVVLSLVVTTVALLVLSGRGGTATVRRWTGLLLVALAAQATIGYLQYFNDVPALLVGFHVAGAVLVFALATEVLLSLYERETDSLRVEPARSEPAALV